MHCFHLCARPLLACILGLQRVEIALQQAVACLERLHRIHQACVRSGCSNMDGGLAGTQMNAKLMVACAFGLELMLMPTNPHCSLQLPQLT